MTGGFDRANMVAYFIIEGCKLEELEVWIEGYEGEYSITSTGIVYSHRRGRKTALSCTVDGKSKSRYKAVTLNDGSGAVTRYVHRLVAQAFIENPENKLTVNHINADKLDNNMENLEWNTQTENAAHAWSIGLCDSLRLPQKERDKRAFELIFNQLSDADYRLYKTTTTKEHLEKEGIPPNVVTVYNPQRVPLKEFWLFLKGMCEDFMSDMTYKELEVKYNLTKSGVSRIRNKNRALEMWECYDQWLDMNSEENNFEMPVDSLFSVL